MCEPVPNTVMPDSTFTRILYSDSDITLVGVHLQLRIEGGRDETHYQKVRTIFDVSKS